MKAYDALAIIGAMVVGSAIGLVLSAVAAWSLRQFGFSV